MESITIKENPRAGTLGLSEQGRAKLPNTYEKIQPKMGRDNRWITGLDENAFYVNNIQNAEVRESEKKRIKETREALEALTGFDLGGTSEFWDTYFVTVQTDRPMNLNNPLEKIAYYVLLASQGVAPSLRETYHVDYRDARFYVARENEDVSDKLANKKKYNEAAAQLLELVKTPDKAILVGRYLGLHVSNTTPQDNVYDAFQTFLDNDSRIGSIDKFMFALTRSPEDLHISLIVDDAMKYQVVRFRDGLYQRGNITLGRDKQSILTFLSDPKNSGELLDISDEVERKRKFV